MFLRPKQPKRSLDLRLLQKIASRTSTLRVERQCCTNHHNSPIEVSDENSSSVRSFPSLSNTVQPIRSRTDIPKSSPFYVPPLALLNTIKHEPQDDQDQHNTALAELRAIITVPSDDNHDDIAFKVAEDDQEYEDVK